MNLLEILRSIFVKSNPEVPRNMTLFPFADYGWFYLAFTVFVLAILALDLGVFHRKAHEVKFKEAAIWTGVWFALALLFNYLFYLFARFRFSTDDRYLSIPDFVPAAQAKTSALEFLTGFVVEKSLAIDSQSPNTAHTN